LAFIFALNSPAFSQKKKLLNLPNYDGVPYHFGFLLGITHSNFAIKPIEGLKDTIWQKDQIPDLTDLRLDSARMLGMTSAPAVGFAVGIIGSLRLGKYFDMRFAPTLNLAEFRKINYTFIGFRDSDSAVYSFQKEVYSRSYMDFPLDFRYKSKRLNNFRAYMLAGVTYRIDLLPTKRTTQENPDDYKIIVKRNDLYLQAGAGIEFFANYFKLGIEAKMGYGFNNLIVYQDNMYSNSIESLRSKVFLLSFTFE
jgi:hypothetical protein